MSSAAYAFPGQKVWPTLQSVYFEDSDDCISLKRCLVASTIDCDGRRLELSDVVFLEDARRWSQAPMSLELKFNDGQQPRLLPPRSSQEPPTASKDRAVCCPDGGTLVQRIGRGFCQVLLADAKRQVKWQQRWGADLGQLDVDFISNLVYLPHYAKGVVHTLRYPDMQPGPLLLCHQRLVTAERVVAKSRYAAVDGFVIDSCGATVPGLAVFDVERSELLCATGLPDSLRKGWTFTVTNDGHLMLAECQVDKDTNRFRLFGFTRSGDLDFTVKILAALRQPWRLQLVKDNLGRDFVREEDSEVRLLVPVDAYLRKERLDSQRLAAVKDSVVAVGSPQSI